MQLVFVASGAALGAVIAHLLQRGRRAYSLTALTIACAVAGAVSIAGLGPGTAAFLGSGLLTAVAPLSSAIVTDDVADTKGLLDQLVRNGRTVIGGGLLGAACAMFGFLFVAAIRL